MGRTTRTMLASVTAAALLTACAGGDDEGSGESPSAATSASDSSQESADAGTSGEDSELDEAAKEAGIDPTSPPEPLSSVTMPGKTFEGDEVELAVDLFGLKRQDDLLVLSVGVTPDADAQSKSMSFLGWTGDTWTPKLIDTQNLKAHSVVLADSKAVKTNTGAVSTGFGPGQTYYLYAVFAAPPQDVTTMTVKLADGAPAVTGVEIQ